MCSFCGNGEEEADIFGVRNSDQLIWLGGTVVRSTDPEATHSSSHVDIKEGNLKTTCFTFVCTGSVCCVRMKLWANVCLLKAGQGTTPYRPG